MSKTGDHRIEVAKKASEATSSEFADKKTKLRKIKSVIKKMSDEDKPTIFRLSDNKTYGMCGRIPTGIISFDLLTGGGFPRGRITQIAGPESAGKSTIALNAIARCLEMGGTALYIDAEHSGDSTWMKVNGINTEDPGLIIATPSTLDEGLELIRVSAQEGLFDIIILDSVVALATISEKGRKISDESIALIARKLSQFFRITTAEIARSKMASIFINQVRTDINTYGAPQNAPGGNALRHAKSLDIGVRRGSIAGDQNKRFRKDKKEIGFPMFFKVVKSKITSAYDQTTAIKKGDECSIDFYHGSGFDHTSDIVNLAIQFGIIEAGGAGMYIIGDEKIRGKDNMLERMENDVELRDKVEGLVFSKIEDKEIIDEPDGQQPTEPIPTDREEIN